MKSELKRPNLLKMFNDGQEIISVSLMIIAAMLVFIQVFLRYVLHAPLMGIEELLLFPSIWLYMIGGMNASSRGEHISCGILTLYVKKEKSIRIFNFVRDLLSLVISGWLTYWAFSYFMYSLKMWKLSDLLYVPMFIGESALFIGLLFMFLYTGRDLWKTFALLLPEKKIDLTPILETEGGQKEC